MTDWKYPAGVKRHPLPPEAVLQTPQKRPRMASGASKRPFMGEMVITVPFDALTPDNAKYGARAIRTPKGTMRAALFLDADYRASKDRIAHIARTAMQGREPLDAPAKVIFRFWMPDRRQRDMLNYSKVLCDGIKGIVIADDSLIHEALWLHMGLDKDSPRVELSIYRRI